MSLSELHATEEQSLPTDVWTVDFDAIIERLNENVVKQLDGVTRIVPARLDEQAIDQLARKASMIDNSP